jgi:hypothetical protein
MDDRPANFARVAVAAQARRLKVDKGNSPKFGGYILTWSLMLGRS